MLKRDWLGIAIVVVLCSVVGVSFTTYLIKPVQERCAETCSSFGYGESEVVGHTCRCWSGIHFDTSKM